MLGTFTRGAATVALLEIPLSTELFASPEPQRRSDEGLVRLNSNENAYGPLPSAIKAMQDALVSNGNRYPFGMYQALRERIAAYHRIRSEQVAFAAGSTEPLRMAAQAYCAPGKNVIMADPTFESLANFAEESGAEIRRVPLTGNFAHDLDGMLGRMDSNTALVYLCNPNNPTGSITPANGLAEFLKKLPEDVVAIVDEAYHHFADGMQGYRSLMETAGDQVVVMRTFSKIYGMAGMRLGYAVASEAVIRRLQRYRLPISVNAVAAAGGIASLDDDTASKLAAQRNAADREEFARQASSRKVRYIPSYANFFMMKATKPVSGLIASFEQNRVLVGRPFPPMNDYLRVSLGLPEEMKTFWKVWDRLGGEG
jgi:histidinol-phosphate aminotransferase